MWSTRTHVCRHAALRSLALRNVLLGTHGVELSVLKVRVQGGFQSAPCWLPKPQLWACLHVCGACQAMGTGTGENFDLQQLVFRDLSPGDRDDVLQHFAVEAIACLEQVGGPLPVQVRECCVFPLVCSFLPSKEPGVDCDGRRRTDARHTVVMVCSLQVVTDYDDTVQLNWTDKRFPRKTVYPGVVAFFNELRQSSHPCPPVVNTPRIPNTLGSTAVVSLDRPTPIGRLFQRHVAADVAQSLMTVGGVVVLTARPAGVRSFVKNLTLRHLEWMEIGRLTLLTGSLRHVATTAGIVRKKLNNFQQVRLPWKLGMGFAFGKNGSAGMW